uniref:DNA topoisomerase I catalytic core eukaryotic-type domain-containing protein n=1 Tax=Aegilops tauschii subsp. strangulata TaxID=200361 RepID=A0A453RXQ7_AEGTS
MYFVGPNKNVHVLILQLHEETEDGTLLEKIAVYQRANKEVAIICNHQRAVSKSHDTQMTKLNEKIDELKVGRGCT